MTSRPKVIVPPVFEPVSFAELAEHLELGTDESRRGYVELLGKAARQYLEHRTCRAFIEQTLEWTLDYWPDSGVIELPRATPLQSITSFTYKDSAGLITALDLANYIIDYEGTPGYITHAVGSFWPTYTPYPLSSIRVRYVAGHVGLGASPEVPYPDEDIKHAIRFLVAHFFENREAVVVGENGTIESKQMELAVSFLMANHELPNIF